MRGLATGTGSVAAAPLLIGVGILAASRMAWARGRNVLKAPDAPQDQSVVTPRHQASPIRRDSRLTLDRAHIG